MLQNNAADRLIIIFLAYDGWRHAKTLRATHPTQYVNDPRKCGGDSCHGGLQSATRATAFVKACEVIVDGVCEFSLVVYCRFGNSV